VICSWLESRLLEVTENEDEALIRDLIMKRKSV
jgi:hypothetical protein